MIFFTSLLVLILIPCFYSQTKIKDILTYGESQEWLRNMTKKQNSSNPYCRLCCVDLTSENIEKTCGYHTMCAYPKDEAGPNCKGFIKMKLTATEKHAIIDAHNTIRNKVASGEVSSGNPGPQPPAANMRAMEWDDELARFAERWAEQCISSKDYCRDSERYPVGQNIAQGTLIKANEIAFIRTWYEKVNAYPAQEVRSYNSGRMAELGLSSYTQIVWADTYHIGCARSAFQKISDNNIVYIELFFCNYGPAGNIPNQPVYRIGKPCSFCPEGTRRMITYPNLCGNNLEEEFL